MSEERTYENWIAVFTTSTDYEADMVRDRLDSAGIPAVVLTQRDHAFNLTVGDLAEVHVMVQPDYEEEAHRLLQDQFSEEELDEAARFIDPAERARDDEAGKTLFDSGNEEIRFSPPEDEPDEDDDDSQGAHS